MTDATHPFDALMEITARPPVVFVRGEGSYLWDDCRQALSRLRAGLGRQLRSAIRRLPSRKRLPRRPSCC